MNVDETEPLTHEIVHASMKSKTSSYLAFLVDGKARR